MNTSEGEARPGQPAKGRITRASAEETDSQVKLQADYTYSIGGGSYAGKFKKTFTDVEEANAWADALRGVQVVIRYDPAQTVTFANLGVGSAAHSASLCRLAATRSSCIARLGRVDRLSRACRRYCRYGFCDSFQLAAAIMGRPHHHTMGSFNTGIVALGIFAGLEAWRGGKKVMRATPEWMKYFGYTIVFYTAFATLLLPRLHPNPKDDPQRIRQQEAITDANFQLLIYFGALETLYTRLSAARRREELSVGATSNSVS